jgi:hypothetical protein
MLCIIADPSDCMALAVTCQCLKVFAICSRLQKQFTFAPCSIRMLSACPHGDKRDMKRGRAAAGGEPADRAVDGTTRGQGHPAMQLQRRVKIFRLTHSACGWTITHSARGCTTCRSASAAAQHKQTLKKRVRACIMRAAAAVPQPHQAPARMQQWLQKTST